MSSSRTSSCEGSRRHAGTLAQMDPTCASELPRTDRGGMTHGTVFIVIAVPPYQIGYIARPYCFTGLVQPAQLKPCYDAQYVIMYVPMHVSKNARKYYELVPIHFPCSLQYRCSIPRKKKSTSLRMMHNDTASTMFHASQLDVGLVHL